VYLEANRRKKDPTRAEEFRNPPGHWDVFFSYHQNAKGKEVGTKLHSKLTHEKEITVWFDQEMQDKAQDAMLEGVRNSRAFLLLMSEDYLNRPFCQMELREALVNEKTVVVIYEYADQSLLGQFFKDATKMGFGGLGDEEAVPLIFNSPSHSEVTISEIISKCNFPAAAPSQQDGGGEQIQLELRQQSACCSLQ